MHPLCFVKVRTPDGPTKKQETKFTETDVPAIFLKYSEDKIVKQVFWDVINIATSLAGGYGAIRVLTFRASNK